MGDQRPPANAGNPDPVVRNTFRDLVPVANEVLALSVQRRQVSLPPSLASFAAESSSSQTQRQQSSSSLEHLDMLLLPGVSGRKDDEGESDKEDGEGARALQEDDEDEEEDDGDAATGERRGRRTRDRKAMRPCKFRRNRYRAYIEGMEAMISQDPRGFDLGAVQPPPFVASDTRLMEKMHARLQRFQDDLVANGAGSADASAREPPPRPVAPAPAPTAGGGWWPFGGKGRGKGGLMPPIEADRLGQWQRPPGGGAAVAASASSSSFPSGWWPQAPGSSAASSSLLPQMEAPTLPFGWPAMGAPPQQQHLPPRMAGAPSGYAPTQPARRPQPSERWDLDVACEVSVTKKVYSNMSTQTEDTPSPPRYGAMDEDAAMLRPPFPSFGLWQGYEPSVGGINNVGDPWRIGTEDRTQPWSFGLSWEARGAMDTPELSAETVALTMAQQVFSEIDCFVDLRDNVDPVKVRVGTDASVGAVGGLGENLYPATVCYKLGWEKVLDKTATPETATPPDEAKKATSGFRGEMSQGAFWHDAGVCRPCNFMYKGDGCRAGADCRFCHLCTEATRRRRKRERKCFLKGVAGEPVEVETVPDVNIEENPDSVIAFGKVLELPAGNCVTTRTWSSPGNCVTTLELPSFPWSSSKEDPSVPWKIKVTRGADKETRFRTELARV